MKEIFLNIETTGKDSLSNTILQMCIIDGEGNILFNESFSPKKIKGWSLEDSYIRPWMVRDKPKIANFKPIIKSIIDEADCIIGYDLVDFDCRFLRKILNIDLDGKKMFDVKYEVEHIYGNRFLTSRKTPRWENLQSCANYYGVDFSLPNCLDSLESCAYYYGNNLLTNVCLDKCVAIFNCYNQMQKKDALDSEFKRDCGFQKVRKKRFNDVYVPSHLDYSWMLDD